MKEVVSRRLVHVAALVAAGAAGWCAHSVWASPAGLRGAQRGTMAESSMRWEQLEEDRRRQLDALAALQRDVRALIELSRRGATTDASALPEVPGAARIAEAADEAPNQPAEIVPTLEQSRAASEAESIVQRATVAGRWTDEDSHRLDDQLRRMAPEDAENLRKEVIAALNRGELEIAFSGRPAF